MAFSLNIVNLFNSKLSAIDCYNTFFIFICFRYACLLDWRIKDFSVAEVIGYLSSLIWCPPQLAMFFAYFPPRKRPNSQDILFLICCPSHLRDQVLADLERRNINLLRDADSVKKMIPRHDKAYISFSDGIGVVNENDAKNVHLR